MEGVASVLNGAVSKVLALSLVFGQTSASTTEAQPTGDDAGGDFLDDDNNKAMFLVLPIFVCVYGSCCVIYCVHKCRRYCAKKKKSRELKKRRDEEAKEEECYFNKMSTIHDVDRARLFENRLPDPLSHSCNSSESSIYILDHGESDTYSCPHSLWGTPNDSQVDVFECSQKNSVPPGYQRRTCFSNPSFNKNIGEKHNPLSEIFRDYSKFATVHNKTRRGRIKKGIPVHPSNITNKHDLAILSTDFSNKDHGKSNTYSGPQSLLGTRDAPETDFDRSHQRPVIPGHRKKKFFSQRLPTIGFLRDPFSKKMRDLRKDKQNSISKAVNTLLETHRMNTRGGDLNSEQETSIDGTRPDVAKVFQRRSCRTCLGCPPTTDNDVISQTNADIKSIAAVRRKISKEPPKTVAGH